jgi:tetrahydromethanopterin S-methyltransferase subunit C
MKRVAQVGLLSLAALLLAGLSCSTTSAQDPAVVVPVVETAVPIVVNTIKPKTNNGLAKFDGTVMNATTAQITVKAKGDDMSIRTFSLAPAASTKMQQTIDKGGYQYGDKVTVMYDPNSQQAVKIKGKASKSL